MKTSLFVGIATCLSMLLAGCNKVDNNTDGPLLPPQKQLPEWYTESGVPNIDDQIGITNSRYFIHGYLIVNEFSGHYEYYRPTYDITEHGYSYSESSEYTLPHHVIHLDFRGQSIDAQPVGLDSVAAAPPFRIYVFDSLEASEEYTVLSNRFGDTCYNRPVPSLVLYKMIVDEFTSIDIVSDRAFDAQHPAGTSLSDIVKFIGSSPYRFIQNDYRDLQIPFLDVKDHFDCGIAYYTGTQLAPISKTLDNLTADDLKLIFGQAACLLFTAPPPSGRHHFTITFRSAEKTLTQTLAVEIE